MSIKVLEKTYPNKQWKAYRNGFGWSYNASNGWVARWVSMMAPRYDGDDGSYQSMLYVYKPDGNSEFVMSGRTYHE